jgi:hypothetical protein
MFFRSDNKVKAIWQYGSKWSTENTLVKVHGEEDKARRGIEVGVVLGQVVRNVR